MGGLETPRILLNSDTQDPKGVGNGHDVVGRYFMEHPHVDSAHLAIGENIDTGYAYSHDRQTGTDGHPITPGICVTDAARRRFKILNHSATTGFKTHRETSLGYRAWLNLTGNGTDSEDQGTWQEIKALIDDIDGAALGLYNDVFEAVDVAPQRVWLFARCEQSPNPDSRVVLTDEVDRLGLRRIGLDWRLTALDKHTIRTASKIVAREIGRLGLGRARLPRWLQNKDGDYWVDDRDSPRRRLQGGNHHMGTTRMALDPRRGVVDQDCRVHGVENLYIAGSSVFPTCGFANPTLTIVELALRLVDHLKHTL
jgi:choline dehydrogenase-like flavoprotein